MTYYDKKCKCGQPYKVTQEMKAPVKDTFMHKCPSCGTTLKEKSSSIDLSWEFDLDFKKID